jgi:hypothetical protein
MVTALYRELNVQMWIKVYYQAITPVIADEPSRERGCPS